MLTERHARIRGRLSFPSLYKKVASVPGGKEKFRANFLIDPSDKKSIAAVEKAVAAAEMETFKRTGIAYKDDRSFWLDGEECVSSKNGEVYDGYHGKKVVKTSGDKRPATVNAKGHTVAEDDGVFYAGCQVEAVVQFYCVKGADKGGNGLFASLEGVKFIADDEPFGAAPASAEDLFGAPADDDEDV